MTAVATAPEAELVVAAAVGAVGLVPTFAAIPRRGKTWPSPTRKPW